jgi:NADPH:quinone reductase-like Zn-dependent oxidoreductase
MSYKRLVFSAFGGPEVLELVEEETLPEPARGEVRVKVSMTSASFTDIMIRKGKYPEVREKPPFSPGYDMIGEVDRVGEGIARFEPGQRVVGMPVIGGCSEYICLTADDLIPVPDELDTAEAVSLVLSYVTAYQLIHRAAGLKAGQRILIHGAGGAVGTALIQLGRLLELEIYGTASRAKRDLVSAQGAVPIDYQKEDFAERILSMGGDGPDAVFDPIGGENLKRSFRVLRRGGILLAYGFYRSVLGFDGSIPLDMLRLKLWNLLPNHRSAVFYSIGAMRRKHPDLFTRDLTALFDLLAQKRIAPVIEEIVPLSRAMEAYDRIEKGEVRGKLLISLRDA